MGRKGIAILLTMLMLTAGSAAPVFGLGEPSEKEEVVYGNLGDEGQTEQVYVVNIFQNQKNIVDYGEYESVRNMTSTDKIQKQEDKITLNTEDETIYYQGNPQDGQLPWDIRIAYYLDGKKVEPKALAGSAGSLEITMDVRENKEADPVFFENYALQVTAALDMENCENIKAPGATAANAGGSKQLTWTLLPGTEKKLELTAKVRDFEMDSISFDGVRMDLDVDVDSSQMTEKFDQLANAAAAIDTGAKKLSSGAESLAKGTKDMKKGLDFAAKKVEKSGEKLKKASKLGPASKEMKKAAGDLSAGIGQIKEAANYQAFKGQLAENGLDLDALQAGNREMLATLQNLEQVIPAQYQGQVAKAKQLLQGNISAVSGMERYLQGLAKSMAQAESGSRAFAENYAEFDKNIQALSAQMANLDLSAIGQLTEGAEALEKGGAQLERGGETLAGATGKLRGKTAGMGEEAERTIHDMLSELTGSSSQVKSFVSEKNTRVKGVQFVIKNKPIEIPEPEPPAESQQAKQSLWQKFLALFQ